MLAKYFLLFYFYSFCGWLMEVLDTKIKTGKWVNRGFMIGPVCPIYGAGCIVILTLLNNFKENPVILFFMAIIVCSIIEYGTSYVMEKLFNLRWWDYSNRFLNINGRICFGTMLPFGILGSLVTYYINPAIMDTLNQTPNLYINIITFIITLIFIVDYNISYNVTLNIKHLTKNIHQDSTEEIKKAIVKMLSNHNYIYKRILSAFPDLMVIFKNSKEKIVKEKDKVTKKIKSITK